MSEAPNIRLRRLLRDFRSGALDSQAFCSQFEHTYNLELDKSTLSDAEAAAFGPLFEEVVWYSPFSEERAQYPGYRSEADIARAAEIAIQRLGEGAG